LYLFSFRIIKNTKKFIWTSTDGQTDILDKGDIVLRNLVWVEGALYIYATKNILFA